MVRYFGPGDLADLADRLEERARAGRDCRLSPDTSLQLVKALRAYLARPTRAQVLDAMRGMPGAAPDRYETLAAANNILKLFEDARPTPEDLERARLEADAMRRR